MARGGCMGVGVGSAAPAASRPRIDARVWAWLFGERPRAGRAVKAGACTRPSQNCTCVRAVDVNV